ncbi:MAG: prolyl oligopeptidase family serine peptidase [Caulobacteraceae bacterium]|nr:prolyl oligopeptidase family serine peptidase [Caulobacteraceae bacterium]
MRSVTASVLAVCCLASACSPPGQTASPAKSGEAASPQTSGAASQRGGGAPYEVLGSQVWDVPDPRSGRAYQVFVQLPASYEASPDRRYPVVYVTDADYAFPVIRQISRRVNLNGPVIEEFILVGLSYARGEDGVVSRNRDYTPTANGPRRSRAMVHGGGADYQAYLKSQVLPYVDERFRTDPSRRILLGHSYGGLLAAQILFSEPELFSGYGLGSPSLWFDRRHIFGREQAYAERRRDLPAEVYMYVGDFEVPGTSPRNTDDVDMVSDVRALERTLKDRDYAGLTVRAEVLNDEDHLTVAPRGFTHALVALLPAR